MQSFVVHELAPPSSLLMPASGNVIGGNMNGGGVVLPPPSSPVGGVVVDESSPDGVLDASSEPLLSSDVVSQFKQLLPLDEPVEPDDDEADPELLPLLPPELEDPKSCEGSVVLPDAQPASVSTAPHAYGARREKTVALESFRSTAQMLTDTGPRV
jgi:hypothetical protein